MATGLFDRPDLFRAGESYSIGLFSPLQAVVLDADTVSMTVFMPKYIPDTLTPSCTYLRGRLCGVNGVIDGLSSVSSDILGSTTTYDVTVQKVNPTGLSNGVRIDVDKKTGDFTNASINTPATLLGYISILFT